MTITVQADASMRGLGAALIQNGEPIAFVGKSLAAMDKRYANIEREPLTIVFACKMFHTYLYGRTFTGGSDHKPLELIHLKNWPLLLPDCHSILLKLQQYDLTI